MALRKRSQESPPQGVPHATADIVFPPALSELKQHMVCTRYPDSKEPRETTTLTLFTDQGTLKCFINDRDNEVTTCVTGDSWAGLWQAVEKALQDPKTEWRARKAK